MPLSQYVIVLFGCVLENGWCFFLEIPKKWSIKSPNHRAHQREMEKKHMLFSILLRQNSHVSWESLSGGKQQPFPMTRPFKRFCSSMWLFHLHRAVKNMAFFPVFPSAWATAKAFFRLSIWSFKEKASTFFFNTAFRKSSPSPSALGRVVN